MATRLPRVRAAQGGLGRDRLRGPARADGAACTRRTSTRSPRSASATAPSPSTSTRTSTCCSSRCSSSGSGRATTSARSATTTSRSTASPAPRPSGCSGCATRFPQATVVRLEENYRSTPQVLALANRLVPRLGGAEKTLRATRPDGPEPRAARLRLARGRGRVRPRRASARCTPRAWRYEEMAVLMRLNARSVDFEELFADAQIPFQGAALLARDGARQLLKGLRGAGFGSLAEEVRARSRCSRAGRPGPGQGSASASSCARPTSRASCKLAEEFDDGTKTVEQWVEWLGRGSRHGAAGRRPPADAPPREGARVRGGLPAAARGEGAAVQGGHARARRRWPRSGGCSTSA